MCLCKCTNGLGWGRRGHVCELYRWLDIISDDLCDVMFVDKWICVALPVLEQIAQPNQVTCITLSERERKKQEIIGIKNEKLHIR